MAITLNDVGKLVAQSAPLLGGLLGGPAGTAIGGLIAAKFGGTSHQPDALHTLINADPQAAVKLKALELEHQLALQQLMRQSEQAEQQAEVQDRASARLREAQVDQTPKENRDKTPERLAYLLTGGVLVALLWLFCWPVPNQNHDLISGIVTSLTTVWIGAMGYYHGSSLSSRHKDRKLMQLFEQNEEAAC